MQSDDKKIVEENIKNLLKNRDEIFQFLDENSEKIGDTDVFDFTKCKELDFKQTYAKFYAYDYAIRKLLPYLYKSYEVKFDV